MEFDSVSSALSDAYDYVKDKATEFTDTVVETADETVQSLKEVSVFPNDEENIPNNDEITINSQPEPASITEATPVQNIQQFEDEPQTLIEPAQNILPSQPLNIQDEQTQQRVINELETQCNQLETDFNKSLQSNGWISGAWHHFKNITGLGASSDKTQEEIDKLKSQIQELKKNPAKFSAMYKDITGEDLTADNLNSFLNKEQGNSLFDKTQAGKSLTDYKEGQEMSVDIAADIAAGIVSVGAVAVGTAAGICAAPLTGGASLGLIAAGLGIAGTAGGVTKSLIKASDCIGNEKEYTRENFKYDFTTGGVNGLAAPLTFGLGGATGTSIMKALGIQSLEKTVLHEGAVQTGKTGLKETASKITANVVSKTVDGGLAGGVDAAVRDIASGKTENIADDILEGIKYGAAGGVALGTAFEQIAKAGKKTGNKIYSLKDSADENIDLKTVGGVQSSADNVNSGILGKIAGDNSGIFKIPDSIKFKTSKGEELSLAQLAKNGKWNFDENTDYNKVARLAECIQERYGDTLQTGVDYKWLFTNISKSKNNNIEDFLNAYDYFREVKTPSGEKIITKRTSDNMLYMVNIDPTSVESSNMDMLLSLVEQGIVDKHVFKYLPETGKMPPLIESDIDKLYLAYDMGISPIDMFVPSFKSVDEAITGKSDLMNLKGTYLEMKQGDVFQVEGEDFIRIKTSDTESEKLNISRDTYFKLFPPIERYASTQNAIGNCWELTGINSLLCENDTRASVLRLFQEEGNNIIIKFPNSTYEGIRFENGKIPNDTLSCNTRVSKIMIGDNSNSQYHSKGALGVKMLEYADGREMQTIKINQIYKKFSDAMKNAANETERQNLQKKLTEFTEYIENNSGNVLIETVNATQRRLANDIKNARLEFEKKRLQQELDEFNKNIERNRANISNNVQQDITWQRYKGKFGNVFTSHRNGGYASLIYSILGYKDAEILILGENGASYKINCGNNSFTLTTNGLQKAQTLLKNVKSFDDYVISWYSGGDGREKMINSELGIVTNHEYRIKPGKVNEDGTIETFKLINPWGITETELTYDEIFKYGRGLDIAKK